MSCVQCVICTEVLTEECILVHLKCGHVYHQSCLGRWFGTSKTCPDCRVPHPRAKVQRLYLHFANHPNVAALNAQQNQLNEQLRQSKVTIDDLKNTIHILDKTHADHIIENYKLRTDKSDLSERLDKFRLEFVQANNELQKLKSENEWLKYELSEKVKVDNEQLANMQIENHQLKKDNVDLSSRLDLFREEFLKANNELQQVILEKEILRKELNAENTNLKERLQSAENAVMVNRNENELIKMLNEEIDTRMLQLSHNMDQYPTMLSDEQSEICEKMNGTQEATPKRNNEEADNPQCADHSKRQKLKEP